MLDPYSDKHGLRLIGNVFENYLHFKRGKRIRRASEYNLMKMKLESHPIIRWFQFQHEKSRTKRDNIASVITPLSEVYKGIFFLGYKQKVFARTSLKHFYRVQNFILRRNHLHLLVINDEQMDLKV